MVLSNKLIIITMKKLLAIFLAILCLPFTIHADDKIGDYIDFSCPEYTYDGEWVTIEVHLFKLTKIYKELYLDLSPYISGMNFKVVTDNPADSVKKIKSNHYQIHFDLKNRIKDAEVKDISSPYQKEAKLYIKTLIHGVDRASIKGEAVLVDEGNEKTKVSMGGSGYGFYILNPKWKGRFEKVLSDCKKNILEKIVENQPTFTVEEILERYREPYYTLLIGDFNKSGKDQLVFQIGVYGLQYGVFVFDFSGKGYKRIFSRHGHELHAQIVNWEKHLGLLVGENTYGGEKTDADLMVYKDGKFVNVLKYKYSAGIQQCGQTFGSRIIGLKNKVKVIQFTNKLVGSPFGGGPIGSSVCWEVLLQEFVWNEGKFKFNLVKKKYLSEDELNAVLSEDKTFDKTKSKNILTGYLGDVTVCLPEAAENDDPFPSLEKALESPDIKIRKLALDMLWIYEKKIPIAMIPHLRKSLHDKEPVIRFRSALLLGYVFKEKAKSAIPDLIWARLNTECIRNVEADLHDYQVDWFAFSNALGWVNSSDEDYSKLWSLVNILKEKGNSEKIKAIKCLNCLADGDGGEENTYFISQKGSVEFLDAIKVGLHDENEFIRKQTEILLKKLKEKQLL
jgi:hypothetical protein